MEPRPETILIIEDEAPIADIVAYHLEKAGFRVLVATDGASGLARAAEDGVDLVILDLMLPELDGLDVLRRLRNVRNVPVIIVSARDAEADKVVGLELGADDYVTKPFSARELIARVRAQLRRAKAPAQEASRLQVFDLVIDFKAVAVTKKGRPVALTPREFDVLVELARHRGQVLSREQLLGRVWGYGFVGDVRTVDVTVRRLREKVEDDPGAPRIVLTRRGVGYFIPKDEGPGP
ncbi:MAG: response regulator transcription factor [Hydrogenibacillus schlegelii]|nr:response regulator transcription factor [Hydrogenibacillus schlegelii]